MSGQPFRDRETAENVRGDIGLLFVHGIGMKEEGQTLESAGRPFLDWIEAWLDHAPGSPEVESAQLKPSLRGHDHPAYAVVKVALKDESRTRLVLAESWWEKEFDPPPFRKLTAWLLGQGAWMAWRQFAHTFFVVPLLFVMAPFAKISAKLRGQSAPPMRELPDLLETLVSYFAGALGSILVVFPLQMVVILLYLLSILPLKFVQGPAKSAAVGLSAIIGDSYTFASNRLARTAVGRKIREDYRWLRERCERVVILAHSQGAAAVFDALDGDPLRSGCRLITYGAGIRKLHELREDLEKRYFAPRLLRVLWIVVVVFALAAARARQDLVRTFSALAAGETSFTPDFDAALAWRIVFAFLIFSGFWFAWANWRQREMTASIKDAMKEFLALPQGQKMDWADLYASLDPVPAGSLVPLLELQRSAPQSSWRRAKGRWLLRLTLFLDCWLGTALSSRLDSPARHQFDTSQSASPGPTWWTAPQDFPGFRTHKVTNDLSAVSDHNSYWQAQDGFVLRVACCLDDWLGLNWLSHIKPRRLRCYRQKRRLRVAARVASNLALVGAALYACFAMADLWHGAVLGRLGARLADLAGREWAALEAWEASLRSPLVWFLGLAAHLGLVGLYVKFVSGASWRAWNRQASRPIRRWTDRLRGLAWMLAFLALAALPLRFVIRAAAAQSYAVLLTDLRDFALWVTGAVWAAFGFGMVGLLVVLGLVGLVVGLIWLLQRVGVRHLPGG